MYLDGDPLLVVWVAEACISSFIDGVFLPNSILHVNVSRRPTFPPVLCCCCKTLRRRWQSASSCASSHPPALHPSSMT